MDAASILPPCFRDECTKVQASNEPLQNYCRTSQYLITKAGGASLLELNPCAADVSMDLAAGIDNSPQIVRVREQLGMIIDRNNVILEDE